MAVDRKQKTQTLSNYSAVRRIAWMFLAGAWLFTVASLAGFSPADPPGHIVAPLNTQPANWCGWVGAGIAYQGYLMFGAASWILLAAIGCFLFVTGTGRKVDQLALRIIGVLIIAAATGSFLALIVPNSGSMPEGAGGLVGIFCTTKLVAHFGAIGTALVLAMAFGVGATVAFDQVVMAIPNAFMALCRRIAEIHWPKPVLVGVGASVGGFFRAMLDHLPRPGAAKPEKKKPRQRVTDLDDAIDEDGNVITEDEAPAPRSRRKQPVTPVVEADDDDVVVEPVSRKAQASAAAAAAEADEEEDEAETIDASAEESKAAAPTADEARKPLDPEALREKIRKLPLTISSNRKPPAKPAPQVQDLSGYKFPPPEMLSDPESTFSEEMATVVRQQAEVLENALRIFKIDAEVVAIDAGPVITLYEVQLAPGTKVSAISAVASDVARELKAQNIRIVPNTAGKSTVGIEVPNLKKEKVRLKELMALSGESYQKMRLPMFLGKDASGNPLVADLAKMPHMLIAGTTGSGKSVCINSIIMSFLLTRRPDELKMVLVDPKMVEMSQFRDIPHLMCPVVTEMNKAAAILEWAVTKMDERYELLAECGCRDIDTFNGLGEAEIYERLGVTTDEEKIKIPKKLPRLVFIIDELADLMMTNKEVEGFIVRIAQKARAVGIHLILATQRPQANVVTGLIKSNMPCRVALKVASGMDSRIVLDAKGAELLLGHGDMLFITPQHAGLTRAQGTLVDDGEVRTVVKFLKEVAAPSFEMELVQIRGANAPDGEVSGEKDPLFDDAVRVVLETKRGSVSLLQRRLAIGYSRSSRLIEQMAEAGILGEYKGSQAREVAITIEEWEAMQAQMAADAEAGILADPAADAAADPEAELKAIAGGDDATEEEEELEEYLNDDEAAEDTR